MTNPFEIILSDSEMKKKLVQGFKKIFSSVYENLPNRWVSTIMYKNNNSFPIWGFLIMILILTNLSGVRLID